MSAHIPFSPGHRRAAFPHLMGSNLRFGVGWLFASAAFNDKNYVSTIRLAKLSVSNMLFPATIWNPNSIVCQAYIRYMSDIFQILTYARYNPGIYLHAKSYDFIGFNACIHSIGRAHWYIEACKEER